MKKYNLSLYNIIISSEILNTPTLNDIAIRNWGLNLNNVYEHYDSYLLEIQTNDGNTIKPLVIE